MCGVSFHSKFVFLIAKCLCEVGLEVEQVVVVVMWNICVTIPPLICLLGVDVGQCCDSLVSKSFFEKCLCDGEFKETNWVVVMVVMWRMVVALPPLPELHFPCTVS